MEKANSSQRKGEESCRRTCARPRERRVMNSAFGKLVVQQLSLAVLLGWSVVPAAAEPSWRMFKVVGPPPEKVSTKRLHARVDGFDLHASTAFAADQRVSIERFCRYALRGPIANGRLHEGPRDLLTYTLKAPKPDGTRQIVLSPATLLERLARLMPAPRMHLIRYSGVLASASLWRKRVVPRPPSTLARPPLKRSGRWIDRASLLRRVFLAEVLACACGGTRRVIAVIEEGPVARKILDHLGLASSAPELAPARLDQADLWPTGPPGFDPDPTWIDDLQRSPDDIPA